MEKKIKIKGIGKDFIITCPVCGYSFRGLDPTSKKTTKTCPMCGYKFIEPHFLPDGKDNFEKRFL